MFRDVASPSYPKTGNTWVRVLMGRYMQLTNALPYLPLMEGTDDETRDIGQRISFTHGPLEWTRQTADDLNDENTCRPYLGGTVLLLVRHPLDVMVSHHAHITNQNGAIEQPISLQEFIESPIYGLRKFIRFHKLWARHADRRNVHILRYEDLRTNTYSAAKDALKFIGQTINKAALVDAIDHASFLNMRKMEETNPPVYKSSGFKIFATGDRSNKDAYHTRSGQIGGYLTALPSDAAVHYEKQISRELDPVYRYTMPALSPLRAM